MAELCLAFLTFAENHSVKDGKTHRNSLENTTVDGIELHFKYLVAAWGVDFPISSMSLLKLQEYVDRRLEDPGMNGRKLSAATIKKEIVNLRTAWNYARTLKIITKPFPFKACDSPV